MVTTVTINFLNYDFIRKIKGQKFKQVINGFVINKNSFTILMLKMALDLKVFSRLSSISVAGNILNSFQKCKSKQIFIYQELP